MMLSIGYILLVQNNGMTIYRLRRTAMDDNGQQ